MLQGMPVANPGQVRVKAPVLPRTQAKKTVLTEAAPAEMFWKPLDTGAWLGKSQVLFGAETPPPEKPPEKPIDILNKTFLNKDKKSYTGWEILLRLAKQAGACDRQPGPAGLPAEGETYPSRYFYLLHTDMGFTDPAAQKEIMEGFRKFKYFETQKTNNWDKAWFTEAGRDAVKFVEQQLEKQRLETLEQKKKDIFPFLSKKFFNKNYEIMTAGEILSHLVKHAADCDGKEGPAGSLPDKNFYVSRYFHLLDQDLGFEDKVVREHIMGEFWRRGLFLQDTETPKDKLRNVWHKMRMSPVGKEIDQAWKAELETRKNSPKTTTTEVDSRYDYVSPPVDLSKLNPNTIINLVDFKPDVLEKIKDRLAHQSDRSEGGKARAWLKNVFSLPWANETRDKMDIQAAREQFDKNFYGMDLLKERIMEEIAVRGFKGGNKGGILLLVGPPGTGKTACAKTLADILGRKFVRRSLSGISDAHKVTGHDYTYIGAKPGMIIDGMIEAGAMNPVFQIDEIDKVGQNGYGGNPLDALLAVLDPQQNDKFTDSNLDIPFDLSKVLFICTANRLEDFPAPLLSRAEVIQFDAYLPEEKLEIAKRHLIPRQYSEYNIPKDKIVFEPAAVERIIRNYTVEGGVRKLEQRLKDIFRKASLYFQENPKEKTLTITPDRVDQWLTHPISKDVINPKQAMVGRVNGLYYSDNGGGTLPVEVSASPGRGGLLLTGSLGTVMQEAAKVALSYIKANASALGLDEAAQKKLESGKQDIHIHYPAGATPKNGPSAGSSTFIALWSALSKTPVPAGIAMTGEIDLEGRITRIGGVLEKVSGAISQGVTTIFLPGENKKDFEDLCKRSPIFKKMVAAPIEVTFVDTAEALAQAVRQKSKALIDAQQPPAT